MSRAFLEDVKARLAGIEAEGLYKRERLIDGAQGGRIRVAGREMVNLCANNYLGLADHPDVVAAARIGLETYGFGMASVRFICGAQTCTAPSNTRSPRISIRTTRSSSPPASTPTAACSSRCSDENDAIISDALNHASIIDGMRLCKAKRYRYANADMDELESRLKEAAGARFKLIVTDGVFSMDGHIAKLKEICALADSYDALVMSRRLPRHGPSRRQGRGRAGADRRGDRVDIVTGTFGKTLGGAMGGFVAAAQPVIDLLRQRARPYLFSNCLAPPVVAGSLKAIQIAEAPTIVAPG